MPRHRSSLTPKQAKFVREYIVDLNGTHAAIRAGYSTKGAEVQASQLLRNPKVAAELAKRQAELEKRTGVNQERVIRELARIAFADMRKFSRWGANGIELVESSELDDDDAVCVAELGETITKEGGSKRFKLHDKVAAITQLAKHLGITPDSVRAVRGVDGEPGQYEDAQSQEQIRSEREAIVEGATERLLERFGHRGNGSAGGNGSHLQRDSAP